MQRVFSDYRELPRHPRGISLTIGNFDGVHRGHRHLVKKTLELARRDGLGAAVLTFEPHPAHALWGNGPAILTPLASKLALLLGLDPELAVIVQPFDVTFRALSAEEFVRTVLVDALGTRHVVVGEDFRFGHDRGGDGGLLLTLGTRLGFAHHAVPLVRDEHLVFSSSRVREALVAGRVDEARAILGRPHVISGVVVRGDGRGRTLGFPTANLTGFTEALPKHGVYAVRVELMGSEGEPREQLPGVMHFGARPTVERPPAAEVHLLCPVGDLLQSSLRVHLIERLRDVVRFESVAALTAQIRADVEQARALLVPAAE